VVPAPDLIGTPHLRHRTDSIDFADVMKTARPAATPGKRGLDPAERADESDQSPAKRTKEDTPINHRPCTPPMAPSFSGHGDFVPATEFDSMGMLGSRPVPGYRGVDLLRPVPRPESEAILQAVQEPSGVDELRAWLMEQYGYGRRRE
jgi:hypothetical protein